MGAGGVVSRVAISVVRRFTIVTGEPRPQGIPRRRQAVFRGDPGDVPGGLGPLEDK